MKKLILFSAFIIIGFNLFAQRRVDTDILIVRDSIIMTGGKVTDMDPGTANKDAVNRQQLVDSVAKYSFLEPRDSILFSNEISGLIHQEGKFYYDSIKQSWVGYIGELDVTFEFMYEDWIRVFNNTGQTIANGDVCYLSGVVADANNTPTVGFANAKWDSTAQSALGFATHSIEDGTYGVITKSGTVRELNTIDLVTSGARLFLDTIDGGRRNTILPSPYFNIALGNAGKIDASDGTVEVSIGIGNNTQSVISIFNGAELETVEVEAVSDGVDMEVIISRTGGGDISLFFNGEFVVFEAPDTIAITPGTDTIPVRNWVYIPNSTRQLTVNTTGVSVTNGFPTNEQYAPIADIIAPSAATAQARGFNKVHVWTDHVSNAVGQGHLSDLNYWVRKQSATYQTGVSLTPDPLEDIFASLIDLAFTSGDHLQLHNHTSPAMNTATGDSLKVYNDPDFSNRPIPNLNSTDLNQDSEGGSLTGQYYPVFVWLVVSEDAEDCQLFLNLPSGSYNNSSSALLDANKYINKRLPIEYKGTAVSLYGLTLQNSGGNIKIVEGGIEDLREDAGTVGGEGGTGGVTSYDELDDTPPSKTGSSNKLVGVNVGESALEYKEVTVDASGNLNTVGTISENGSEVALSSEIIDSIFTTENIAFSSDSINYIIDGVTYNVTEIRNPDGIDQGGIVTLESGLIYNISPCKYQINGVPFESITSQETLTTADPTNPRIDIIVVDTFGVTDIVTGVAAASPQKPTANPTSQIELTSILVNAGATTGVPPSGGGSTTIVVYDENVEWTGGQVGTTVDFASATAPFHGTVNAEVTNISNSDYITFTAPTAILATGLTNFSMYLKLKEAATKRHKLYVQLIKDGGGVTTILQLPMDYTNTEWQNLSISLEGIRFSQDSVNEVQLVWAKTPDAVFSGFYIDLVQLQGGYDQVTTIQPHTHPTSDITGLSDDITLQNAYNGGTKIITNADSLAVKIQSGTGDDADNVFEILNNAGSVVGEIDGNGNLNLTESVQTPNIGVNTTPNPSYRLDVNGQARVNRTSVNGLGLAAVLRVATDAKTANDAILIQAYAKNSDDNEHEYGRITTKIIDPISGTEDSEIQISHYRAGSRNEAIIISSNGDVILSDAIIADAYGTNVQTLTETAGAVAWDVSGGSKAKVTIDETSVITITNMPEGAEATIRIVQGDAGDDNVTFVLSGATVEWRGDDTDLTDASGAVDYISVVNMDGFLGVTLGIGYVTQ